MQICNAEKLPEVTEHKKKPKYETKIEESANASTGSCLLPALGDLRGEKPAAQPAQRAAPRTKCKFDQRLGAEAPGNRGPKRKVAGKEKRFSACDCFYGIREGRQSLRRG
jgi:hypothetical protein